MHPNAAAHEEPSTAVQESEYDWNVPTIAEESLDRLTTMFTIYPVYELRKPFIFVCEKFSEDYKSIILLPF